MQGGALWSGGKYAYGALWTVPPMICCAFVVCLFLVLHCHTPKHLRYLTNLKILTSEWGEGSGVCVEGWWCECVGVSVCMTLCTSPRYVSGFEEEGVVI